MSGSVQPPKGAIIAWQCLHKSMYTSLIAVNDIYIVMAVEQVWCVCVSVSVCVCVECVVCVVCVCCV